MANTGDRISQHRCSRARRLYCTLFTAVFSYKPGPFYSQPLESLPAAQWPQEPSSCQPVLQLAPLSFGKHYLWGRSVFETKYINSKDVGRIKYLVSSHWKIEKQSVCFGPQTGYRTPQVTRRLYRTECHVSVCALCNVNCSCSVLWDVTTCSPPWRWK
jgi:hypothetical protein